MIPVFVVLARNIRIVTGSWNKNVTSPLLLSPRNKCGVTGARREVILSKLKNMSKYLSVAVGVIQNSKQEILLAQRSAEGLYGNFREFPGGKVEPKEISRQALTRELYEELGIEVQRALPLIRVHHDYGERQVLLDVWRITEYQGEPHGREGQSVAWVPVNQLMNYPLLPANKPIVTAIRLPQHYVITPSGISEENLYQHVQQILQKGYRLIRFRAYGWDATQYLQMIPRLIEMCLPYQAQLMLDGEPKLLERFAVAGLHLTSAQLLQYHERPISKNYLLAVSCHNAAELTQAHLLDTDFAVLAPVFPTASHPNVAVLGWPKFFQLVEHANFPVYALGGMSLYQPAIWFGAQGVAGIRMFT